MKDSITMLGQFMRLLYSFVRRVFLRRPVRLPILFIHTPKTAGTSLRNAAVNSLSVGEVICDYGKDNPINTVALNSIQYHETKDQDKKLDDYLTKRENYLLIGHFFANRYSQYFYPDQIAIFLRNPVDRIISDYQHKFRKNNYSGTLSRYILHDANPNLQFKQFGGLPLYYVGFVGLSERFNESLKLMNSVYGLNLKSLAHNQNPGKPDHGYEIDDELKSEFMASNQQELQLYSLATALFEQRLKLSTQTTKWLYGSWRLQGNTIIGRAYKAHVDEPVNLSILKNGAFLGQVEASSYKPIPFNGIKQPREGKIGFEFTNSNIDNPSELVIMCNVSNQVLPFDHNFE